jgi:hypothetical protein
MFRLIFFKGEYVYLLDIPKQCQWHRGFSFQVANSLLKIITNYAIMSQKTWDA